MGEKVYQSQDDGKTKPLTIIGVVKDFNFESLHQNISPLCFSLGGGAGLGIFKVHSANLSNLIAGIQNKWKTMAPGLPFNYRFLNESFDKMYRAEQRVVTVSVIFSVLAIFIACLGLFGLATFIAKQRTKEIGIRKVLGASVTSVTKMLSKDFIKLVIIACIIAIPVSYLAMNKWLQGFAYRIHVSWWIFLVAGIMAILIALITVSFQAIKAAVANPVDSLRSE